MQEARAIFTNITSIIVHLLPAPDSAKEMMETQFYSQLDFSVETLKGLR